MPARPADRHHRGRLRLHPAADPARGESSYAPPGGIPIAGGDRVRQIRACSRLQPQVGTLMDCRLLSINKDHRGCVLLDRGRPIASYTNLEAALELARTLVEANRLRSGPPVVVEVRRYGQRPRRIRVD